MVLGASKLVLGAVKSPQVQRGRRPRGAEARRRRAGASWPPLLSNCQRLRSRIQVGEA